MQVTADQIICDIEATPVGCPEGNPASERYRSDVITAVGASSFAVPLVFYQVYHAPDMRATELMSLCGLNRDGIVDAFETIRRSETLQKVLALHPTQRNFVHKLRTLLASPRQIEKMVKGEPAFPLAIEMHASTECNSRCAFCYSRGHWYYEWEERGVAPLDAEQWTRLVDECADNGTRKILPTGGLEPLMALDKFLAIMRRSHERDLDTLVFTNGVDFDPENTALVDAVLRRGSYFVSVRGATSGTYAQVTGTSPAWFHKSVAGMRFLAEERARRRSEVTLGFAFFITPRNYAELPGVLELARDVGVDEVGLSCDNLNKLQGFDVDAVAHLRGLLRSHVPIRKGSVFDGLKITMNDTLLGLAFSEDSVPEIYRRTPRRPYCCRNWYLKAAVDPFGNFYPCCLLAQPGIAPARNVEPFGRVSADGGLTRLVNALNGRTVDAAACITCNPSEYSGLRAFEKLKDDHEAGIDLEMQPYKV